MCTSVCSCVPVSAPGNIICASRRSFFRAGGTTQRASTLVGCGSCGRSESNGIVASPSAEEPLLAVERPVSLAVERPRCLQLRDQSSRRTSSAFQHSGVASAGLRRDARKTRRHATSSTMKERVVREHCSRRQSSRAPSAACMMMLWIRSCGSACNSKPAFG